MKLLFITHDASRSGAPMVLLHFLRWLQEHQPDVVVDVLALKDGAMASDFKAVCGTYYDYKNLTKKKPLSLAKRVLRKLKIYKPKNLQTAFITDLANQSYDVIYANTVVSIPVGVQLKAASSTTKLIAHVHELNTVITQVLPDFETYTPYINHFIAASKLVAKNLNEHRNVSNSHIKISYEFSNIQEVATICKDQNKPFVVGASGAVSWRKGYDVFIQIARYVNKHYPNLNIVFEWVGHVDTFVKIIIEEDLKKLGLAQKVLFKGSVENPSSAFSRFDVFLMVSREDPFPLVCIEIGMLGKPIISFEDAVGTNEVLSQGGGFIVPYLDIEEASEKIKTYYTQQDLLKTHGAFNKKTFSKFNPDILCPELFGFIKACSSNSGGEL